MRDLREQRLELTLQRRALENTSLYTEQQIVLEVYKFYKLQLDRISRILVEHLGDKAIITKLADDLSRGNPDAFTQFLVENDDVQSTLMTAIATRDPVVSTYVIHYIDRYHQMSRSLTSTDRSGTLRQAIVSESPISSLYSVLNILYHDIPSYDESTMDPALSS
jgi:hypothetical protein